MMSLVILLGVTLSVCVARYGKRLLHQLSLRRISISYQDPSNERSSASNIRLRGLSDCRNATGRWYAVGCGQPGLNGGRSRRPSKYFDLEIVSLAKVAPQVVCQVTSSNNVPAAVTWDNDLDHFGLFTERWVGL